MIDLNAIIMAQKNINLTMYNLIKSKMKKLDESIETPKHYDNSKGTLYKVATERGWNSYLFDSF